VIAQRIEGRERDLGGFSVRPHPHVALATVTYLFRCEMLHRDSLGSQQEIRPGDCTACRAGSRCPTITRTTRHPLPTIRRRHCR
jgi:hypothetical protein